MCQLGFFYISAICNNIFLKYPALPKHFCFFALSIKHFCFIPPHKKALHRKRRCRAMGSQMGFRRLFAAVRDGNAAMPWRLRKQTPAVEAQAQLQRCDTGCCGCKQSLLICALKRRSERALPFANTYSQRCVALEHVTLEMLAYGRQKPAFSHFVARIFKKILAEQLTHFIRKLLYLCSFWAMSSRMMVLRPGRSGLETCLSAPTLTPLA